MAGIDSKDWRWAAAVSVGATGPIGWHGHRIIAPEAKQSILDVLKAISAQVETPDETKKHPWIVTNQERLEKSRANTKIEL